MRLRLAACFAALTLLAALLVASPAGEPDRLVVVTAGHADLAEAVNQRTWAAANHVRIEELHAESARVAAEAAQQAQERRQRQTAMRVRAAAAAPPQAVSAHGGLPPILLRIRRCESHDNYQAQNPRSSASGAYQFLASTWRAWGDNRWPEAWLAPPAVQDAAALRLYEASGTRPWAASAGCWS